MRTKISKLYVLLLVLLISAITTKKLIAQETIYSFQQVDTLPIFQDCPSVHKLSIDDWIDCFFPKLNKLVGDSIKSMEQQLDLEFEGLIKVSFNINNLGQAVDISILNKPHPILKKGARDVLKSLQGFKPAKLNGSAVSMNLVMEIDYTKKLDNIDNTESENTKVDTTIYTVKNVDIIPKYPECIAKATKKEQAICTSKALYQKYVPIFKYPAIARETGIQGTVVIALIIEKDGYVSKVTLKKDIGGGCGQAVLDACKAEIKNRIQWIPAQKDGQSVRCQFIFPVSFTLG